MRGTAPIAKISFPPLVKPAGWPPWEISYRPTTIERHLWWIPVVGWVAAWGISIVRYNLYERDVVSPIAKSIIDQLESRRGHQSWPETPRQRKIVEIIAEAVSLEKGIARPLLHPGDFYNLLCWGPVDDLTPALIFFELKTTFGLNLAKEEKLRFWKDDWTLQQFVDYCDWKISKTLSAA
jgi:hypothetical protein